MGGMSTVCSTSSTFKRGEWAISVGFRFHLQPLSVWWTAFACKHCAERCRIVTVTLIDVTLLALLITLHYVTLENYL